MEQLKEIIESPTASREESEWATKQLLRHADNRIHKLLRKEAHVDPERLYG